MKRVMDWFQGVALALGGPGLFVIAFLDSSFLSFPEVADLLIVYLTVQHPHRMLYYAFMTTVGSVLGCFVLYSIARKGGEAFLRKRLPVAHVERAQRFVRKYGLLSVLIPSLLPPPMPFKMFVLAAGVAEVRAVDFLIAVTIGRGIRYFGEGLLALWYGEQALDLARAHAKEIALVALALVAVGVIVTMLRRRRTDRPAS